MTSRSTRTSYSIFSNTDKKLRAACMSSPAALLAALINATTKPPLPGQKRSRIRFKEGWKAEGFVEPLSVRQAAGASLIAKLRSFQTAADCLAVDEKAQRLVDEVRARVGLGEKVLIFARHKVRNSRNGSCCPEQRLYRCPGAAAPERAFVWWLVRLRRNFQAAGRPGRLGRIRAPPEASRRGSGAREGRTSAQQQLRIFILTVHCPLSNNAARRQLRPQPGCCSSSSQQTSSSSS